MTARLSTVTWMVIFAVAAFALYLVKYQVQDIKNEVDQLEAKLEDERDAMKMLRAEWAYLNRPDRLDTLSKHYLDLQMLSPDVVAQWDDIPLREQAVAAATDEVN